MENDLSYALKGYKPSKVRFLFFLYRSSIPKKLEPENIIFSQAPGQSDYWRNTRDLDGFLINIITGTKVK